MCLLALWAVWAEAKEVVDAETPVTLGIVDERTCIVLAEASLIVGTGLLSASATCCVWWWMSVDTSLSLLVAVSILLVVLADGDFVRVIGV